MVPDRILAEAAARGTYVHKMCELHDLGKLGEFDQKFAAYLDAWIWFLEDTGFESEVTELKMHHPLYKFAGAVDNIGICKDRRIVLDKKTTYKIMPSVGPQLAAYGSMWDYHNPEMKFRERWAVQLKADGRYNLEKMKDPADFSMFLACLKIQQWKVKNNV